MVIGEGKAVIPEDNLEPWPKMATMALTLWLALMVGTDVIHHQFRQYLQHRQKFECRKVILGEIHPTVMRIFRHFLEVSTNFGCHLLKNSNNAWETDKNFIKYIKSILGVMNQKLMPAEIFANSCLASSRCWRGNSSLSILFFALMRFIDIIKVFQRVGTWAVSLGRLRLIGNLGDLFTESGQPLQGSFSAVSKPTLASKYSKLVINTHMN